MQSGRQRHKGLHDLLSGGIGSVWLALYMAVYGHAKISVHMQRARRVVNMVFMQQIKSAVFVFQPVPLVGKRTVIGLEHHSALGQLHCPDPAVPAAAETVQPLRKRACPLKQ